MCMKRDKRYCLLGCGGHARSIADVVLSNDPKADIVFAYGNHAERVKDGMITGGMSESRGAAFQDREKLIKALKNAAKPGDVILFKGSHGMHLELVLEAFLKEEK